MQHKTSRPASSFYSTHEWFKLASKVKARWRASGRPCAFCGQAIDWSVKGEAVADHIENRKARPDLALVESNIQVVHGGSKACNTKKAAFVENSKRVGVGLDGLPDSWR